MAAPALAVGDKAIVYYIDYKDPSWWVYKGTVSQITSEKITLEPYTIHMVDRNIQRDSPIDVPLNRFVVMKDPSMTGGYRRKTRAHRRYGKSRRARRTRRH